jgi:hypothetical protein
MDESSRNIQKSGLDMASTEHLPVRMLVLFTKVTIVWWIAAGVAHSLLIAFDQHNKLKDFTGSNDMAPLRTQSINWPEPASLFKVDGLYCSDSHMWVASGFSIYEISAQAAKSAAELSFVKDGSASSAICGAKYCSSLSQPENGGPWVMSSLPPSRGADAIIPIPKSWRKVTGSWTNCSETEHSACESGWLVGWDGARVLAATLKKSSAGIKSSWHVDPRFETDPAIGLCAGNTAECIHHPKKYDNVRALHLSSCGRLLLVLLNDGILDFWDLAKGTVVKRAHVGDPSYTAMCQSGGHVYFSREDGAKPSLTTMDLPFTLSELTKHPQPLLLEFHRTVANKSEQTKHPRPLVLALHRTFANRSLSRKQHPVSRLRLLQHAKLKA